jgi:Protein of unknown function (DUF2997)
LKIIEVIVSPTGETKIETKGFADSSCQAASQFLEQALGAKTSDKFTAEFYQQQAAEQRLQQGGAP